MDEKALIFRCRLLHKLLEFKEFVPLHSAPSQKCSVFFVSFPMLTEKHAPLFCQFFGFGYNLKTFLSICRSLFVLLHLSTHPSKTGEELLYYHIYHELLLLNLTFQPELFNGPFVYTFFKAHNNIK